VTGPAASQSRSKLCGETAEMPKLAVCTPPTITTLATTSATPLTLTGLPTATATNPAAGAYTRPPVSST